MATNPETSSTPKRPKKDPRPCDYINLDNLGARALITKRQILTSVYPVSETTLWRRINAGKFPGPVESGPLCMWRVGDVAKWLDAKSAKVAA